MIIHDIADWFLPISKLVITTIPIELYMDKVDKRRTLYWNPSVRTDENGKAVIECYNNQYSTPVIIQAETMSKDGQIGSMKYSTIGQAEQ